MKTSKRNKRATPGGHRQRHPAGVVLIIVLVVITVISLSAYTFSSLMLTHHRAAELGGQQLQAHMLVESGVEAVKLYLMQDEATREEMGGHFDNPLLFRGLAVVPQADLKDRGSFTVLAPLIEDTSGVGLRFGLEDESIRLNLNVLLLVDQSTPGAARELLLGVPGMTEEVADAILDWMDEDDEPREYGAEREYYSALSPPYEPQNGPLTTIEELLLVRGVYPELLFGVDVNRNTLADPQEMSLDATASPAANAAGTMTEGLLSHRGWSAYLTLYSAEKNVNADGLPRINLNQEDLQQLYDELLEVFSEEWAGFIVAYRLYGPYGGNEEGQEMPAVELDLSQPASTELAQVLDLIGVQVQLGGSGENDPQEGGGGDEAGPGGEGAGGGRQGGGGAGGGGQGGGEQPPVFNSPFANDPAAMATYLPLLMDNCTVSDSPTLPGRININAAPPEVLLGIPGMEEELLTEIIEMRDMIMEGDTSMAHESWLLTSGVVDLDQMRTLLPFVNAGGDVFRAQVVGYFQGGGPAARVEVVLDATGSEPRILLWRDIGHLGRGYALEMLGVDLVGEL